MAKALDKAMELKYVGHEPSFEPGALLSKQDLQTAYGWYSYHFTGTEDARKMVLAYMPKADYTEAQVAKIREIPAWKFISPSFVQARLINQGYRLPPESVAFLHGKIIGWLNEVPVVEAVLAAVGDSRLSKVMGEIDGQIDDFSDAGYPAKATFELDRKLTGPETKKVVERVNTLLEEVKGAVAKSDPQLVEAYANLSPAKKKNYVAYLEQISSVFGTKEVIKKVRKPRRRKPVPVGKQIGKLLYSKDCAEHKIKSIDPEKILGAKILLTYNTKYNTVTVYCTEKEAGLTVKPGSTTIEGYDEKLSFAKRVRKPKDVLPRIMRGTSPTQPVAFMRKLKTKASEVSSRTSRDTVLLKVFK